MFGKNKKVAEQKAADEQKQQKIAEQKMPDKSAAEHTNDPEFKFDQGIKKGISNIIKILDEMGSQKEVILQISEDIQGVAAFAQSVSDRLKNISVIKTKDGETTDLGDVTGALADCTERVGILMKAIGQENNGFWDYYDNFKNILYQFECVLKSVHVLLGKMEKLNIGELSKGLPTSTGDFEARVERMLSSVVEKIIPPSLMEELEKLNSAMLSIDLCDIDKFKEYSVAQQNFILLTLQGANHVIKSFMVKCDEVESRLGFKEGSILKEIPIGVNFSNNPVLAKFSVSSRTLEDVFKQVSMAYDLRLDAIEHENKPSMFPYTDALLRSRIEFKIQLCRELAEYSNDVPKKIADRMKKHLLRVIETGLKENTKSKGADSKKRKEFLEKLSDNAPISDDELLELKKKVVTEYELSLDDKIIKKVLEEVGTALKSSCGYVDNQVTLRQALIQSVQAKIDSASKDLGVGVNAEVRADKSKSPSLTQNIISLALQPYQELRAFVANSKIHRYSHKTSENTKKEVAPEESMLIRLKNANRRVQDNIKEVIDPYVYETYFVLSGEERRSNLITPEVLPWVGDIGKSLKAAKRALRKLEQLVNQLNGVDKSRVTKLPDEAMNEMVLLGKEFVSIMGEMGLAIQSFASNPSLHDMQSTVINWRTTVDHYIDSVKKDNNIERNQWLGFDISRGLSKLSMAETNNAVITSIDVARSFYAHVGARFEHGLKQRNDIDKSFVQIRQVMVDKYKTLDDDPTNMDYLRFVIKHSEEILAILPHAGQIKNALANASVEEGLQLLARLNGLLKSIMLMADELELALCLRKGYISQTLLSVTETVKDENGKDQTVKKSLDSYMTDLLDFLKANDYVFPSHDTFPYDAAMMANRKAKLAELKKVKIGLCAERDALLATKKRHETRIIGDVLALDGDLQLKQLSIKRMHEGYEKSIKSLKEIVDAKLAMYESLPDNTAEEKAAKKAHALHTDLFVLYRMINNHVLPQLNRSMDFNLARLKPLLEIKAPSKEALDEIAQIQARNATVQQVREHWRVLLKLFPSGIAFEGGKDKDKIVSSDAEVENLKQALNAKEVALFNASTDLQATELKRQNVQKIERLQELEALKTLTPSENHELIHLRAFKCGLKSTYQENEQQLHDNAARMANLNLRMSLLSSRIAKLPVVAPTNQLAAKTAIVDRIEVEIQKMNKQRFSTSTLFGARQRLEGLRCVEGLTYISQHYQRSGYTLLNAKRDLMGNNEDLYNVVMKRYLPLFKDLIKQDDQTPKALRGQMIIDNKHLQKPVIIKVDNNVVDKLQDRIDTLTVEYNKKHFFKQIKRDKIALLRSLACHLQSHSLTQALSIVREKNLGTFHLLFEGRTGDMFKQIERDNMTKADAARMINAEITRLNIKKNGLRFFAKSRGKVIQFHIQALEALRDGKDLTPAQLKLLQLHDKELLLDCQKVLPAEFARPVKRA